MIRRMPLSGRVWSFGPAGMEGTLATLEPAVAGDELGLPFFCAPETSLATMRPPGPVPWRLAMSTPRSAAILRASGELFTRSPGGRATAVDEALLLAATA